MTIDPNEADDIANRLMAQLREHFAKSTPTKTRMVGKKILVTFSAFTSSTIVPGGMRIWFESRPWSDVDVTFSKFSFGSTWIDYMPLIHVRTASGGWEQKTLTSRDLGFNPTASNKWDEKVFRTTVRDLLALAREREALNLLAKVGTL